MNTAEQAGLPGRKDQEALMKQGAPHDAYGAPPPPYYDRPQYGAGDGSYVPPPMQAIVIQPQGGVYVPAAVAAQSVPDHLIYAVLATICCCWPIGLFAIIKSIECRNAINRGDLNQAIQLSRQTRRLANWTIGVGVLFLVLSFLVMGVYIWLAMSQMHHHRY